MTSNRQMSPIGAVVMGLIFLVLGCAFLAISSMMVIRLGGAQRSFRQVTGRVLSAEVASSYNSKGHLNYAPKLRYSFPCPSGTCYGDSLTISDSINGSFSEATSQEYVDAHPSGSSVPVFYDPVYPSKTALDLSGKPIEAMGLLFPAIHAVIGLSLFLTGLGWSGRRVSGFAIRAWFIWGFASLLLVSYTSPPFGPIALIYLVYFSAGFIALVGRMRGWKFFKGLQSNS